jgi:hypothetical protein
LVVRVVEDGILANCGLCGLSTPIFRRRYLRFKKNSGRRKAVAVCPGLAVPTPESGCLRQATLGMEHDKLVDLHRSRSIYERINNLRIQVQPQIITL